MLSILFYHIFVSLLRFVFTCPKSKPNDFMMADDNNGIMNGEKESRPPDKRESIELEKRCECSDEERKTCDHEEYECVYCPCDDFSEKKDVIQCPACFIWYHTECVGLKELTEDELVRMKSWLCYVCWASSSPIAPTLPELPELERKSDGETTIDDLRDEIAVLEGLIKASLPKGDNTGTRNCNSIRLMLKEELNLVNNTIASTVERSVETHMAAKTGTWSDLLKQKTTVTLDKGMVEDIVEKNTTAVVESTEKRTSSTEYERQKRKKNVVIRNFVESPSEDSAIRTKYDYNFLTGDCLIERDDILTCYRAGKRQTDKIRPLICVLKSESLVQEYTRNGRGANVGEKKNPEDQLRPYWINLDLCSADAAAAFRARQAALLRKNQNPTSATS